MPKSAGIAILLTLLFGPIGLFYASVNGGLIMTFGPVIIFLISTTGRAETMILELMLVTYFILFSYLTCMIWAVVAVKRYNTKLALKAVVSQPIKEGLDLDSSIDYDKDLGPRQSKTNPLPKLLILLAVLITLAFYLTVRKNKNESLTYIATVNRGWIINNTTNLYSRPNINSRIVGQVSPTSNFTALQETKYFIKVQFIDGGGQFRSGYLAQSALKKEN